MRLNPINCCLLSVATLATLGGSFAACDAVDANTSLVCPADPGGPTSIENARVKGTVSFAPPAKPLTIGDTLSLVGTALHDDGLTIREVRIASVSANRDEFNFRSWSATIGYEHLLSNGAVDADGNVEAAIIAFDACERAYTFATMIVPIDTDPGINVDAVDVSLSFPADRGWLPADGSASAVVTVEGSGKAVGAVVTLSASSGRLDGTNSGTLVLSAVGGDETLARATALYYADTAGTHLLTAETEGLLATTTVVAGGAPRLVPNTATLTPGSSLAAVVITDGALNYCQASQNPRFDISHNGLVFGAAPVPMARNPQGEYVIDVAAIADGNTTSQTTISCFDDYSQFGSALFTVQTTGP